jgi:hypothetical protein
MRNQLRAGNVARMRLDFSEFHPLDHWPATARCRSLPGGAVRHLRYAWVFRRREQAMTPLYKLLRCPLGRHAEQIWYCHLADGTKQIIPSCRYCDWTRLPSEAEIDAAEDFPRFG